MLRTHDDELIVEFDTAVDFSPHRFAPDGIFRKVPGAYALSLQVGVEAVAKALVFAAVTDKAGEVLDGFADERMHVGQERIRYACLPQKALWNGAT